MGNVPVVVYGTCHQYDHTSRGSSNILLDLVVESVDWLERGFAVGPGCPVAQVAVADKGLGVVVTRCSVGSQKGWGTVVVEGSFVAVQACNYMKVRFAVEVAYFACSWNKGQVN